MKAWRCIKCHRTWTESQLNESAGVKTCCDVVCGGMVCNVTHTLVGEKFIAKQNDVPLEIHYAFMEKRMPTNYGRKKS